MSKKQASTADAWVKMPDWLKVDLFEKLLRDSLPGFKAVRSFKAMPGTKPGDNYATLMLRVQLETELDDGSTKTVSYMLKLPHDSTAYQDTFGKNEFSVFDIERDVFMIYVEEFRQLYREAGLEVEFGAKCYRLDTPHQHVLLEDLRPKGFQTVNRQMGVDEDHVLTVLTKLAQWHAASAVRVDTKGPYPRQISEGLFNKDGEHLLRTMTDGMVPYILKTLTTIEGCEAYYEDIEKLAGSITDKIMQVGVPDPEAFNVLNHGDCWLSNLLFLYDGKSGKVLDSYLVDYQMCIYGSVSFDLLHFLLSSPKLEVKFTKFDYFVKQYYDQLIKHLKLLNYRKNQPSLIDIHKSLLQDGIWAYFVMCGVLAGSSLENAETASFDNLFSDTPEADEFRTLLYTGKLFKDQLKAILPWLHNRGALQSERS